ncbi:MAG: hypothetical protein ACTS5I_08080, partial [Rhodanobacter sp.]
MSLRPWLDDDAAELHRVVAQAGDRIGRWLPWCHADYSTADAMAWVRHCQAGWATGEHFFFRVGNAAGEAHPIIAEGI